MHNLCVFCTFCTFAQKIFKGWGCNFTWRFGKVMRIKSLKMVFVARIITYELCMIYAFFYFFVQKSFWPKINFLLLREIWLAGSIVYLSCFTPVLFYWSICFCTWSVVPLSGVVHISVTALYFFKFCMKLGVDKVKIRYA